MADSGMDNESEGSAGEEDLDPRIQCELERLNRASQEINDLELSLQDARSKFRATLDESTRRLESLSNKLGACVEKARPYYQARINARTIQAETQKSALRFERACSMHAAAKEMVNVAEQGFLTKGQHFDAAWQEMLNHATTKVNEAETEIMESELEHAKMTYIFHESEQKVKKLQREHKRSITKSRQYFELKSEYNRIMEDQKKRVGKIGDELKRQKALYSLALKTLERISDEIHAERERRKARRKLGKRVSGVGSETPDPSPEEQIQRLEIIDSNRTRNDDEIEESKMDQTIRESSEELDSKVESPKEVKPMKERLDVRRESAPSVITSSPSKVSDPAAMILNVGALKHYPSLPYAEVAPKTKKTKTKPTPVAKQPAQSFGMEEKVVAKDAKDAASRDTVSVDSEDILDTDSDSSSIHVPDDDVIENALNDFTDDDFGDNNSSEPSGRFMTLPANMNFADLKNYFKQGELKKWGDVDNLH